MSNSEVVRYHALGGMIPLEWGVGKGIYVRADDYDALEAAVKDPEKVFLNMKRGAIATPSVRLWSKLFGEVLNDDDARLIEIARLRERLAELEAAIVERDAAIEEWSGTAVQNGMECARLRDQCAGYEARIERLEEALRDIAGKHHYSASAGEYFSTVAQEALSQEGQEGET